MISQRCRRDSNCLRLSALHWKLLPWLLASSVTIAAPASAETTLAAVDYDLEKPAPAPAAAEPALAEAPAPLLTAGAVEATLEDTAEAPGASSAQVELSFGEHVKSIRTELAVAFGYMTAVNLAKIADRGAQSRFKFHDEGLFGRDTRELGMDKLVHAHNAYILSELIGARIRRNTGTSRGTAVSGALLSSGLMLYSEIYDGFKAGFGFYDLAFNSMGAGFSVLRHTTPGLEEKLDFRVLIMPNRNIYSPTGLEHYRQLRYLLALELAGFDKFKRTPLRFVELHVGYYGKGFTEREKERGEPLQRKPFVGIGLNINELLFAGTPRSRAARAASQSLDYWQPPYTYIHAD